MGVDSMLKLGFSCGDNTAKADRIIQLLANIGLQSKMEPDSKHGGVKVTYYGDGAIAIRANRLVNSVAQ